MSVIPGDLRYTKDHEWLRSLPDGAAVIGITDYAQGTLGDVTFVELPAVGKTFGAGATFGVVESVKAASDLYLPVEGTVVEVNPRVTSQPELVNADPYGAGWLIKIRPARPEAADALLDATAYLKLVG